MLWGVSALFITAFSIEVEVTTILASNTDGYGGPGGRAMWQCRCDDGDVTVDDVTVDDLAPMTGRPRP